MYPTNHIQNKLMQKKADVFPACLQAAYTALMPIRGWHEPPK